MNTFPKEARNLWETLVTVLHIVEVAVPSSDSVIEWNTINTFFGVREHQQKKFVTLLAGREVEGHG